MHKAKMSIVAALLVVPLAGCADLDEDPIIDTAPQPYAATSNSYDDTGRDGVASQIDVPRAVEECRQFASRVQDRRAITVQTFGNAVSGLFGGIINGAIAGQDIGRLGAAGAAQGAVAGAFAGWQLAEQEKMNVLRQCLLDRGIRMLN